MAATAKRNLFDLAEDAPETVSAPEAAAEVPVRDVPGLGKIAKLDAAKAMLDAERKLAVRPLCDYVLSLLIEAGNNGVKPVNFTGVEGAASASCQYRKSGTNTPLDEVKEARLTELGIPVERRVLQPATYRINPLYALDPAIVKKAGEALADAKLPDDLIQRVPEVSYAIVGATAIDDAYANYAHDPDRLREVLNLCGDVLLVTEWNGEAREVAQFAAEAFLADAQLPATERAIVKAKALEKSRRKKAA